MAKNELYVKNITLKELGDEQSTMSFEGIATTYGNEDREGDIINPDAFINFKDKNSVTLPLLFNHNTDKVIGKITLTNGETEVRAKAELIPNLLLAQEVYEMLKFDAISGLSIGFSVLNYQYRNSTDPYAGLIITMAELVETSVVTVPANDNARVSAVKKLTQNEIDTLTNIIEGNIDGPNIKALKESLLNKLK